METTRHRAAYLVDQWRPGDQARFGRATLADIGDAAHNAADYAHSVATLHPINSMTRNRYRADARRFSGIAYVCRAELDRLNAASAAFDVAAVIPGCRCSHCDPAGVTA